MLLFFKQYYKALLIISGGFILLFVGFIYMRFMSSATDFEEDKKYICIPSATRFNRAKALRMQIDTGRLVRNKTAFLWLANKLNLWKSLKPGRYEVKRSESIYGIIKKLKQAKQASVNIVFKKYRTKEQLAGFIAQFLEGDSASFMRAFTDIDLLRKYQLNEALFFTIIITNTYQFMWTTTPKQFIQRCIVESDRFWNKERKKKARAQGLTQMDAYILASIVEEESNKDDEKPIIASVYLNRLRKGMRLEADPTARYCTNDFTLRRILIKHINTKCSYNTYLYSGLPPGPICTPSIASIDAVLAAPPTRYLFFCARPERDGYHNFAETHFQHMRNARAFHKKLNQEKVR